MITVVRILHVGVAAAWFGHKLLIPFDIRSSLKDPHEAASLVVRLRRAETLGISTGMGTLITGGLLAVMIGPGIIPAGIYVGLGLVVVAIAVGAIIARPASIGLRASVTDGRLDLASTHAARLTSVLVVESVLWSGALVAMLV